MRKVVAAVFAHPDDEAFGPSGTIAKFAKTHDVYVLCATKGEAGENHHPEQNRKLAELREEELRTSAKILGVKKVYFLNFLDGTLSNNLYHQLAAKIEERLKKLKPDTIMTYEPRGVSGHIDHVTISMVTTFVFEKLSFAKTLMYYCLTDKQRAQLKNYFIYFPPGYKKSEVDKIVDISHTWDLKLQAIQAHTSQAKDMQRVLNRLKNAPKEEYFLIKKK